MKQRTFEEQEEERDVLFGVINRFIGYFTRMAVPQTSNDTSCEYPFVAMDTRQAYEQVRRAVEYLQWKHPVARRVRFLDIGCGIGNILLLAEMLGCDVFGIEKDNASIAIARKLVGDVCIGQQDIWHFDGWDKFDIVYYFRPFCEKEHQLKFEQLVEDGVRPGAVLIANRKMSDLIDRDARFVRLDADRPVWYKDAEVKKP